MSETQNRNLPLVNPDQPQREGVARLNTALSMIDADIAALLLALGTKANASDIGPAITAAINALVAGAPAALDTLAEVAAKLAQNDDAVAAIMASLSSKANAANVYSRATVDGMLATEAQARVDAVSSEATARADADAALQTAVNARQAALGSETKAVNFTGTIGKFYILSGTITATFPANPAENDNIAFLHEGAETTPYTLNFNGKTFEGNGSITVGVPFPVRFVYTQAAWRLAP